LSAIEAFLLRIKRKNTLLLLIVKRRAWREFTLAGNHQAVSTHKGLNANDDEDESEEAAMETTVCDLTMSAWWASGPVGYLDQSWTEKLIFLGK
jgi:hypothetical protein